MHFPFCTCYQSKFLVTPVSAQWRTQKSRTGPISQEIYPAYGLISPELNFTFESFCFLEKEHNREKGKNE